MYYPIQPWKHQLDAIERAKDLLNFALFMPPGVGKTATAIHILRWKYNNHKSILRTLIVCPPIVVPQWKDEWLKNSKLQEHQIVLLRGTGKRRLEILEKAKKDDKRIIICNYETLLMAPVFKALKGWEPQALVLDESHKVKNRAAKRTKACLALSTSCRYRYLLTGTPATNTPMDLFSQFLIMDGGETFGKNFFVFRATFFYDRNAGMPKSKHFPDWRLRPNALEEMSRIIQRKSITVKKEQCIDLPPLVKQTIKVEMTPEQARLYKEMKRDLITFMGTKVCMAGMALTKALRLMQLASGFIKFVDGDEIQMDNTPKMAALSDLLEEITPSAKVIVWCVFRQNYEQVRQVCTKLGVKWVELTGEQTETQKQASVISFRSDPEVRVLIGNPASGGVGVNLIEASYMIYYSRNFSLTDDDQSEARCYRGGSVDLHTKVTRIDLVTEGTIEEMVSQRLAAKKEMTEELLKDYLLANGQ